VLFKREPSHKNGYYALPFLWLGDYALRQRAARKKLFESLYNLDFFGRRVSELYERGITSMLEQQFNKKQKKFNSRFLLICVLKTLTGRFFFESINLE
jgi:hypothetical protein